MITSLSDIEQLETHLDELVKELQEESFVVSSAQFIYLLKVIESVRKEGGAGSDQLKQLLGPIVCRTEFEQKRFCDIYNRVVRKCSLPEIEDKTGKGGNSSNNDQNKGKSSYKKRLGIVFFTICITVGGIWYFWSFDPAKIKIQPQINKGTIDPKQWQRRTFFLDSITQSRSKEKVKWLFGDSTSAQHTTQDTTIHVYPNFDSTYNVRAIIGQDTLLTKVNIVSPYCQIAFEYQEDSINKNAVVFRNTSPGLSYGVRYKWDFGDGSRLRIQSDKAIVKHTYSGSGPFSVTLMPINYACKPITATFSLGNQNKKLPPIPLLRFKDHFFKPYNWVKWLIPLLILLVAGGIIGLIIRWVLYKKQGARNLPTASEAPFDFNFSAQDREIAISENLEDWARQLQQREEGDRQQLDILRSLDSTIRHGGAPILEFKRPKSRPSYLVLIDERAIYDQQARLYEFMSKTLAERNVNIETLFFYSDPRHCWGEKYPTGIAVEQLQRAYPDYNLVLMTEGSRLIDHETGNVGRWFTDIFGYWSNRGILTPIDAPDWDSYEKVLSKFFVILPAVPDGQILLRDFITKNIEERPAFDEIREQLSNGKMLNPFLGKRIDQIDIDYIKTYLTYSNNVSTDHQNIAICQWAYATSLFSTPDWNVTIAIGKEVEQFYGTKNIVSTTNLVKIMALPWMRIQKLSQSLQQNLYKELDKNLEDVVRRRLLKLLKEVESNIQLNTKSYAHANLRISMGQQWLNIKPKDQKERIKREIMVSDLVGYYHANSIEDEMLSQQIKRRIINPYNRILSFLGILGIGISALMFSERAKKLILLPFANVSILNQKIADSSSYYNSLAVSCWQNDSLSLPKRHDSTLSLLVRAAKIAPADTTLLNLYALNYNYVLLTANTSMNIKRLLDPKDSHSIDTIMAPLRGSIRKKSMLNERIVSDYLIYLRYNVDSAKKIVIWTLKELKKTDTTGLSQKIKKAQQTYQPLLISFFQDNKVINIHWPKLKSYELYKAIASVNAKRYALYFNDNSPAQIPNPIPKPPKPDSQREGESPEPTITMPDKEKEKEPVTKLSTGIPNYGILRGRLERVEDRGNFIYLLINSGGKRQYQVAVDVENIKEPSNPISIYTKDDLIGRNHPGEENDVTVGFTLLDKNRNSGALDYLQDTRISILRSKDFENISKRMLLNKFMRADNGIAEIYIWGSRVELTPDIDNVFKLPSPAYEIQNVHFNQGTPNGSPHYNENGVWQDGGILIASNSSEKSSYIIIKFKSQTFNVDENGNPKLSK